MENTPLELDYGRPPRPPRPPRATRFQVAVLSFLALVVVAWVLLACLPNPRD
jgi:hypothetical protein